MNCSRGPSRIMQSFFADFSVLLFFGTSLKEFTVRIVRMFLFGRFRAYA